MALTAATIDLSFTSQYTSGCHRLGYRIQGSGDPYTMQDVVCTPFIIPNPPPTCLATIDIMVDDETCDAVTYEGYIQPCCQDEESLEGRVAFTVTFTPNPTCKSYQLTCDYSSVESIEVMTPGSGYTPGPNIPVTIVDPTGTLATAECRIEDGGILTFVEVTPGVANVLDDGLYSEDQVIPVAPDPGAPVSAFVNYEITGGLITLIELCSIFQNVDAPGADYVAGGVGVGNTFTLPAPPMGWITPPVYRVTAVNTGQIIYCPVLTAGSNYTGPTTASVAAGPETEPVLFVVNTFCNPVEYFGVGCDGDVTPERPDVPLGATVQLCRQGDVGTPPADMSIVEGGCCAGDIPCEEYTITSLAGYTGSFSYINCCTRRSESSVAKGEPVVPVTGTVWNVIALEGSLAFYPPGSEALLTIVGPTPYVCP